MAKITQKITPFIWFEKGAEDAAEFYVDLFNSAPGSSKKSKVTLTSHYSEAAAKVSGQPAGAVMVVAFELEGMEFSAINGGPFLKLSGGISFVISCSTQEEIDFFWGRLSHDGEAGQCGWINRDPFGVTWQITPALMGDLMSRGTPEQSERVMSAMLKMTKIDIAKLEDAFAGK
jgi:predicted 3-demethylubiquinone-9 3-methyltransferase (glyoxalase superfamily)